MPGQPIPRGRGPHRAGSCRGDHRRAGAARRGDRRRPAGQAFGAAPAAGRAAWRRRRPVPARPAGEHGRSCEGAAGAGRGRRADPGRRGAGRERDAPSCRPDPGRGTDVVHRAGGGPSGTRVGSGSGAGLRGRGAEHAQGRLLAPAGRGARRERGGGCGQARRARARRPPGQRRHRRRAHHALLVEARDEALGLAGRRASGGTRRPRTRAKPASGGRPRAPVPRCRQVVARGELAYRRTVEGSGCAPSEQRFPMARPARPRSGTAGRRRPGSRRRC